MDTSGGGHKKGPGVKKGKKASTRVDLTPMVDLGFLLITFFIFATTLATPKAARFRVPTDDVKKDEQMKAVEAAAMTVLLGPDDKSAYFYTGTAPDDKEKGIKLVSFDDMRKAIIAHKKYLPTINIQDSMALFSIKAMPGASWGTFMNAFDEVLINDIKQYVKVKPSEDEMKVVNAYNEFNKIKEIPKDEDEEVIPSTAAATSTKK